MPEPLSTPNQPETVFTYAAPSLVYGRGAIRDIAFHLRDAKRVLIVTDPGVAATGAVQRVVDALGCQVAIWDDTHIEPTDVSSATHRRLRAQNRPLGCVRGCRWWLQHRHGQGSQPHVHQPRRTARLCERSDRRRPRAGTAVETLDRCADHYWNGFGRAQPSASWMSWTGTSRPGSAMRGCGPPLQSSIRT